MLCLQANQRLNRFLLPQYVQRHVASNRECIIQIDTFLQLLSSHDMFDTRRYAMCNSISCSIKADFHCCVPLLKFQSCQHAALWHATSVIYFLENIEHFIVNFVWFFGWWRARTLFECDQSPCAPSTKRTVRRNRQKPQRYFRAQLYMYDVPSDGTSGGSEELMEKHLFDCEPVQLVLATAIRAAGDDDDRRQTTLKNWIQLASTIEHLRCSTRCTSSALRVNIKSNVSQYCNWFYYFIQFYITRRRVGARCTRCSCSKYIFIVAEPFYFLLHFAVDARRIVRTLCHRFIARAPHEWSSWQLKEAITIKWQNCVNTLRSDLIPLHQVHSLSVRQISISIQRMRESLASRDC